MLSVILGDDYDDWSEVIGDVEVELPLRCLVHFYY
jgi:hypothetical protein